METIVTTKTIVTQVLGLTTRVRLRARPGASRVCLRLRDRPDPTGPPEFYWWQALVVVVVVSMPLGRGYVLCLLCLYWWVPF